MPVETPHPLYSANIHRWARCRRAYDGEDAVKAAGADYLPKIDPTQTGGEYKAYQTRASYYEAVARTVDGFVGAVARKPHTVKLPEKLSVFVEDATGDGMGLDEFVKALCAETMLIGRCGVLCDFDAEKQRAFFSLYTAEAILSWSASSIVLSENVYEPDREDEFKQVEIPQIRQLHVVEGAYTVTIWRKNDSTTPGQTWAVYSTATPTKRGLRFGEIPFYWLSPMGQTVAIQKPALLGLVNISLSHYRTSADLEHGRHFTGLPTLWVTGAPSDTPISVGAGAVIVLAAPEARVGYAEFTGQGLGSLENALEAKERQMAVLGAAVFTGQKKGVEAAETARIRTAGENSLLMGVVTSVEDTLITCMTTAATWMGATGAIEIKLNRDFVDQSIEPQEMIGLVAALQAGGITVESFLFNLQQAEMLPPDTVISEEVAKLKKATEAATALAASKPSLAGKPSA